MPTVCLSVDCEAANVGKCYTRELIQVAEEFTVPLSWLWYFSEKNPTSNIDLYYTEYQHRIPSWHETGLLVHFENSAGYIADPKERGDAIRIAKDAIKSRHVKPTVFRGYRSDVLASDLKILEDIGILVDASLCPGGRTTQEVAGAPGPTQPYHPSYDDLRQEGDAKTWMVPLAVHGGLCAILDFGWDKIRPIVEHSLAHDRVTHLSLSDHVDNAKTLRNVLELCKEKGARVTTLTQLASEL